MAAILNWKKKQSDFSVCQQVFHLYGRLNTSRVVACFLQKIPVGPHFHATVVGSFVYLGDPISFNNTTFHFFFIQNIDSEIIARALLTGTNAIRPRFRVVVVVLADRRVEGVAEDAAGTVERVSVAVVVLCPLDADVGRVVVGSFADGQRWNARPVLIPNEWNSLFPNSAMMTAL